MLKKVKNKLHTLINFFNNFYETKKKLTRLKLLIKLKK